jgi:hypothetical protein
MAKKKKLNKEGIQKLISDINEINSVIRNKGDLKQLIKDKNIHIKTPI